MTTDDDIDDDIDAHDTDAKLARQQRRQLSALVDGELAPEQARFLLRRLGHDEALAGRWQRWQLVGDVLRGEAVAALPAGSGGFAARVAASVAGEAARPAPGGRMRWQHGVGLAAAASVAALALIIARPVSLESELPADIASVEAHPAAPAAEAVPAPAGTVREVSVPQFADTAPAIVPAPTRGDASMPVPRPRLTEPVRQPSVALAAQAVDPPPPAASIDGAPEVVLAGAAPDADARPFASPAEPQARPWPRAALPGLGDPTGGRFTVGFGDTVEAPSFYPFEPQLPERAADDQRGPDDP